MFHGHFRHYGSRVFFRTTSSNSSEHTHKQAVTKSRVNRERRSRREEKMTDDEVFLSKLLNTFATLTKESNSGKHATSKFQLIVTDSSKPK